MASSEHGPGTDESPRPSRLATRSSIYLDVTNVSEGRDCSCLDPLPCVGAYYFKFAVRNSRANGDIVLELERLGPEGRMTGFRIRIQFCLVNYLI